jgi:methyl-accepting chemotaxis protein
MPNWPRGIDRINHTVSQMDNATQRNPAPIEEAAAALASPDEQAGAPVAAGHVNEHEAVPVPSVTYS